ncbi:hypothetical protein VTK73DRAFT_9920 [Phialemonium thermophilum]|uniref:PH domain-containing protein n=1 Tax=Phialemonium thermophilum TaxID=223376 RepID=A0ABR3VZJ3_9PEZI
MAQAQSPVDLPSRQGTQMSTFSDDAVPEADPSTTAGLLTERLQAWKHAVGYLEEYMESVEKAHKSHAKEYEKVLKTISKPLKEGHHFDQSLGGVAGFFENMRANTQALINTNLETEKSIKQSVLPILERLHKEIKNKTKELAHGAQKGAKEVDKLRNTTQKHIELLGQTTASFESRGGKLSPHDDPYVIHRGVLFRLNHQILEENNHRNDLIAVQTNFQTFEAHIVQVVQQAMEAFNQFAGGQAEKARALFSDMLGAVQRIPPDFEWKRFESRSADKLVNPNEPPRMLESVQFPNMNHPSTKPLIEGTLQRKSRNKLSWGYQTGYYVVTPSKYLHEFKDSDNLRKDPTPELSIYLPDAIIGLPHQDKFSIKGKDESKKLSGKLTGHSEISFKANSTTAANQWVEVIKSVVGDSAQYAETEPSPDAEHDKKLEAGAAETATTAAPLAPAEPATAAGTDHPAQEAGVIGTGASAQVPTTGEAKPSADTAVPVSTGAATTADAAKVDEKPTAAA